ncbi:Tetratricopeptide repeat protein 28 (TPR repeat protein 28) (TPR repeat-containing big gene cloned at Keio) [Durusdinium trenchii]|uniref:Tetratricopeptide repeat protein 28 (TPR repeat protein 28) (TPR repeat-containing big gene cloned at Keio) n=1 Tax=Durusdinium trenchii TaxID=1381693 RepID=A0ABP0HZT2_9DINO
MATTMQEKPQNALSISGQYLEKFKASRDRRGEAVMLLCLAEINHDKRGRKKRQEALETAAEALRIFSEVQDRKFEALTLMVTAMAHYKFFMYDAMLEDPEATRSLDIAEELGDKFLTGRAQNLTGLALSSQRRIDDAMERGRAALAIWRELGMRRQEAIQTHAMAGWLLYSRWPKKALALAEQTLQSFREIGPAGIPSGAKHRREAMCVYMIIEVMAELKQYKPAIKFAKSAFERFGELGCQLGQGMVKDAMGRVYIVMDKPDKAIEAVDEAREIADRLGDKRWSAKLLFGVAQAHMKAKDTNEAIETLDKTIGLAQAAGDMQETSRLQQNLIDALLFRQRNPKAALRVAKEARTMAQKNGDKRAEAMAILREAMAQGSMGKKEDALKLAKQAQEFFQESYWPRGEAQCLHFMADLRGQAGDLDQALECAEERLAVLRGVHDLSMEANAMMQLAQLHMKDDNYQEAERLAQDAAALGKKDRNPRVQVDALLLLTQLNNTKVLDKLEDKSLKPVIDRAVRTVNEALQVAGKAENRSLRALVLFKRAETMVLAGRHQTGLRDVKEAAAIFEAIGHRVFNDERVETEEMDHYQALGRCMLLSGNIKHALGQVEQGEADVEKADLIAKDIGDHQLADEAARSEQGSVGAVEVVGGSTSWEVVKAADVLSFRKALEEKKKEQERAAQAQIEQPQLVAPAPGQPAAAAPVVESVAAPPEQKGLDPVYVRKQLAAMVKDAIASDEELELDSPFMDAGMDSLSSVALMSMVAKDWENRAGFAGAGAGGLRAASGRGIQTKTSHPGIMVVSKLLEMRTIAQMRASFSQDNIEQMKNFDPELARKAQIAYDNKLPVNFQQLELIEVQCGREHTCGTARGWKSATGRF